MYLDRATLRTAAGAVIVCGFEQPALDATLKEVLREVHPLGLIAFDRNVASAAQATALNRELKSHAKDILLAIDHEGGPVARIKDGVTRWPPLQVVGDTNNVALAEQMGAGIAHELRAIGFDINFAPVVDVDTNPQNPIIGPRAFSRDAEICARLGAAFVCGHQSAHVGASAKHFPGHGDTSQDSHVALPHLSHERDRLEAIEWPPFRAAVKAHVSSIMTAHVSLDAIDEGVPATISPIVLSHVLRNQLLFKGAIVADDIDMQGLRRVVAARDVGARALLAGCDVLLSCHSTESTMTLFEGIVRAAEAKLLPHEVLSDRATRALAWRRRWHAPLLPEAQAQAALGQARARNERLQARFHRH